MQTQQIILGAGCFWCAQSIYHQVIGVVDSQCGYIGGTATSANYEAVCQGNTRHIEAVRVVFGAPRTLQDILALFFVIHDPTSLDRQGGDIGRQYRSAIFYQTQDEYDIATQMIAQLCAQGLDIQTKLYKAGNFYIAEDYHQHYFAKNPNQGYCNAVIPPKIAKARTAFNDWFR